MPSQRLAVVASAALLLASCSPTPPPRSSARAPAGLAPAAEDQALLDAISQRAQSTASPEASAAAAKAFQTDRPDAPARRAAGTAAGVGYQAGRFGFVQTFYHLIGGPTRTSRLNEASDPWATPGCSDVSGAINLAKPECRAAYLGRYGQGVLDPGNSFSCGNELTGVYSAYLSSLCLANPGYFGHDGAGFDCQPTRREITDASAVCDGAGVNAARGGLSHEWARLLGPGVPERCLDLKKFDPSKPTPFSTRAPIWGFTSWICNKPDGSPPPPPPPPGDGPAEIVEVRCGAPGEFVLAWKRPPAPGTVAFEQTFRPGVPSSGRLRIQVKTPGSAGTEVRCPPGGNP